MQNYGGTGEKLQNDGARQMYNAQSMALVKYTCQDDSSIPRLSLLLLLLLDLLSSFSTINNIPVNYNQNLKIHLHHQILSAIVITELRLFSEIFVRTGC